MIHPLKAYREQNALTQDALAEILGISRAMVTHIENGRRPVTPRKAIDWERQTGIPRTVLCPEIFGAPSTQAAA